MFLVDKLLFKSCYCEKLNLLKSSICERKFPFLVESLFSPEKQPFLAGNVSLLIKNIIFLSFYDPFHD